MDDIFADENPMIDLASPLNYTGSKFSLLPQIRTHFPIHIENMPFYDVFAGGGSIFINAHYKVGIYANDIISPLIEFYKSLQTMKWEDILREIESRNISKTSQEDYLVLRERFNQTGNCFDFFVLVCCCTNNMMRFNKKFKFNQTWGKRHFNPSTRDKLKEYSKRLFCNDKIVFSCKNFTELEIQDGAFVYLDPPYQGSIAGYNAYWSKDLEDKLYDFIDELNSRKIKFMLSNTLVHKGKRNPYENRFSKYKVTELKFDYDKVSRSGESNTIEILVTNYE